MSSHRFKIFAEIAAVFAVFFLFGAWQTPDVNEAHYIGKAINYWNPDWIPDDPFLDSRDAHWTFYFVFGWLTFFCSPTAMAWIGRITAWSLLAWSWQRLSFALIPIRGIAIPTALALAYYIESFNMAGEWLIGGIEGKSLAYPFVFFALEAMLRRRWNRVGIFLGIATALHVLVGGWATLIAAGIFLTTCRLPSAVCRLQFPWIGLIAGGLFALCGLVPVLMLNAGTSADIINEANQIYVFKRLPHHLVPYLIKDSFVLRFALLTVIWILLCRHTGNRKHQIFNAFIWGTLGIAAIGMILAYGLPRVPKDLKPSAEFMWSAEILRFYWFRLSDIAIPMGVAIGGMRICISYLGKMKAGSATQWSNRIVRQVDPVTALRYVPGFQSKIIIFVITIVAIYFTATYLCFAYFKFSPPDQHIPWAITLLICLGAVFCYRLPSAVCRLLIYIALVLYAPLTILPKYADLRTHSGQCRTDPVGINGKRAIEEWKDMCQWIQENTPNTAKFWIPRDGHTFNWYAYRSDIGTWKNIPQDAASIVQWYEAMNTLYRYKDVHGKNAEDRLLTSLLLAKTEEEIADLQQKYGFEYVLCAQWLEMPKHSTLENVYENDVYCLYRVLY